MKARHALERVCSGAALEAASHFYGPSFFDHVNDLEFHGLAGVERSVELYRGILADMAIRVEEQVVSADRVTSRFVVTGTCYRRRVHFNGITISRFEDGLIVEDWSVTDTVGLLRQLGFARMLLVLAKSLRSHLAARRSVGSETTDGRR